MKTFEIYLLEKSFEMKDVPRTFRVVLSMDYDNPEKTLKELADMKLEGMTGISDKHDIAFHWLGVARDMMLIMKGKEVLKQNKISRIMYSNPHYMLSNNMNALRRMWQKESERATQQLMFNLLEYYFKALIDMGVVSKHDVEYVAAYQSLSFLVKEIPPKIDGIKDFIKWFRKALNYKLEDEKSHWEIKEIAKAVKETSDSKLEKAVYETFKIIESIYGSEGEWIVKDRTLQIPKGSHLYILVNKKEYEKLMKMKKEDPQQFKMRMAMSIGTKGLIEKYENIMNAIDKYNLRSKYVIKFIDGVEWKKIQSAHLSKKR